MKRFLLACSFVFAAHAAAAQGTFGPTIFNVPAWTPQSTLLRMPATGATCIGDYAYLGGSAGLNPNGDTSRGTLTLKWTTDAFASQEIGNQSLPLASLIVSQNQLRLPNLGPCVYLTYTPYVGTNGLALTLSGTNAASPWPEIAGDTILIDATLTIPPNTSVGVYPDDYFAGQVRFAINCDQPNGYVSVYARDLTDQYWWLDATPTGLAANTTGAITSAAPLGTWWTVASNASANQATCRLSATPLLTPPPQ